jgi:hypothetical protein
LFCFVLSGYFIFPLLAVLYTTFLRKGRTVSHLDSCGYGLERWCKVVHLERQLTLVKKCTHVCGRTRRPWSLARYNPPFTISFLRTNEIHIPVVLPAASASSECE